MLDESSGDVIMNQPFVSLQCPVEILRNPVCSSRQDLLVLVSLRNPLDEYPGFMYTSAYLL